MSVKLESILFGTNKQNRFFIFSEIIGKVQIKIDRNKKNKRGINQKRTPLPNNNGTEANTPNQAPLEFIRLIAIINKIQNIKTIANLSLELSFLF